MIRRVLSGFAIIVTALSVFVITSCGTNIINNEEQGIKTYTCPNDNMFGFEKAVVFEDGVVAVFDKGICDSSDFGGMSYDKDRVKFPAYADYTNLSKSRISESFIEEKKGKYVATMKFEYDEADKFDPDEDINITGFVVLGKQVTFNEGDIELFYTIEGGECFDDYRQVYSQSSGKWRDIKNELVAWPLYSE